MAQLNLIKLYDSFAPADDETVQLMEKMKHSVVYKCVVTKQRNYKFHKKLFSLLNLAFEHFEPGHLLYDGVVVKKEFEQFRKDIIIKAGYYHATYKINGDVILTAKSLKFSKMGQDEFDALYNACVNVVLDLVLTDYTKDDLENVINQLTGYF